LSTPERIRTLRLQSGRSEQDLAAELGLTQVAYSSLEQQDGEIEAAISISQALRLANLLSTDLLEILGETEKPTRVPIARVRAALNQQLGHSSEAREGLQDAINWDLEAFLEGAAEWTSVYTIEFLKSLAVATEIDWQVLLAGIEPAS
jgi:transcriptional regulator with XRE-family HTH domain